MLVMESKLTLYNTLDRRKETFEPINPRMWECMSADLPYMAIRIWDTPGRR